LVGPGDAGLGFGLKAPQFAVGSIHTKRINFRSLK